jgi:hypothetical protein
MNMKRSVRTGLFGAMLGLMGMINLLGLPASPVLAEEPSPVPTQMSNTLISVDVSKTNVNPGDTFDLNLTMDTDAPTWGVQFELQYDPKLVEITAESQQGNFYKDYSDTHNGTIMVMPEPQIDNNAGQIKLMSISVIGLPNGSGGPTGKGTIYTFHGKAKDGANGTAVFKLAGVLVSDAGNADGITAALGGIKVRDGVIAIGSGAPAATEAVQAATAPVIDAGPTPTLEPTVEKLTSLDGSDASTQSSVPWAVLLPILGVVVVGGGAFVVLRKK